MPGSRTKNGHGRGLHLGPVRLIDSIRKSRGGGKRIALKGRFVFSTQEVLEVVQQAKAKTAAKKSRKRRRGRSISLEREDHKEHLLQNHSSDSEESCIILAASRAIIDAEEYKFVVR